MDAFIHSTHGGATAGKPCQQNGKHAQGNKSESLHEPSSHDARRAGFLTVSGLGIHHDISKYLQGSGAIPANRASLAFMYKQK
jgi:hypothetical protein